MNAIEIGSAIRKQANRKKITQEQLASAIGVTIPTIKTMFDGGNVGFHYVLSACKVTGIKIMTAVEGHNEPESKEVDN